MEYIEYTSIIFGLLSAICGEILAATTEMSTDSTTATTTTPGAPAGGDPPANDPATSTVVYTAFFDDPHNQATYIVLPVMIIVYGGCASIYCIAKCRKSCRKRARRKREQELMEKGDDVEQQNSFDNMAYDHGRDEYGSSPMSIPTPTYPYESRQLIQNGAGKMGYNIMPLPNSTEDPVLNANIDIHLKNAFAMIEHAARDIKMQQALGLKSCPDRYPTEGENNVPLPKKSGYKRKYFIAV